MGGCAAVDTKLIRVSGVQSSVPLAVVIRGPGRRVGATAFVLYCVDRRIQKSFGLFFHRVREEFLCTHAAHACSSTDRQCTMYYVRCTVYYLVHRTMYEYLVSSVVCYGVLVVLEQCVSAARGRIKNTQPGAQKHRHVYGVLASQLYYMYDVQCTQTDVCSMQCEFSRCWVHTHTHTYIYTGI